MSPFRNKPAKWDGEDENGRFKERNGFKFDILTQRVVTRAEEMPRYFLSDDPDKAAEIYDEYSSILNTLASSYAMTTGISKTDLFGEALIGLARASRDWDPKRGKFKAHAIFKIKDALNECVRSNAASVSVPAYIKKANTNLNIVKNICSSYDIEWQVVALEQEIPDELDPEEAVSCAEAVKYILRAAERAKVPYEKFIDRISFLPEDVDYSDEITAEEHLRRQQMVEAALVVEKLKKHMDETERTICNDIMADKTYSQIAEEFGKSKGWVAMKIRNLRDRLVRTIEEGKL